MSSTEESRYTRTHTHTHTRTRALVSSSEPVLPAGLPRVPDHLPDCEAGKSGGTSSRLRAEVLTEAEAVGELVFLRPEAWWAEPARSPLRNEDGEPEQKREPMTDLPFFRMEESHAAFKIPTSNMRFCSFAPLSSSRCSFFSFCASSLRCHRREPERPVTVSSGPDRRSDGSSELPVQPSSLCLCARRASSPGPFQSHVCCKSTLSSSFHHPFGLTCSFQKDLPFFLEAILPRTYRSSEIASCDTDSSETFPLSLEDHKRA